MADADEATLARTAQQLTEKLLRLGIDGFGPFKSAHESAAEALEGRTADSAVKRLIRSHVAVGAAQGFATNVGGLLTLPVALPANIGAAYLVQTHLAAAIAAVHGHDLDSEDVRTAILLCLLGNAGVEVVKKAGVVVGQKFSIALIKRIPVSVIYAINKRAGFMLLAKFGTKRATLTLAKGVPVMGGLVGASFDAATTKAVGTFSHRFFSERV